MNIVLAIQSLEIGGAERQVLELALGLRKLGHNVSICCLNTLGLLADEAISRGIEVICLNKKYRYDLRVIFKLNRLIRNRKIDVLHTFLFGADLWGRIAGRLANVKVLLTSNRSGGVYYEKKEYWFDRILWPLADGIISNTNAGKDALVKKTGISESYIKVVHNGFDFRRFENLLEKEQARKNLDLPSQGKVVAMTGRVWPGKNHKMMVRVARIIKEKVPDVRFLVIGISISDWDQIVKQYAGQEGVLDNILFLGQRTDVPELLAAADAGILCSLNEGFPNAVMEYMAAGLPVVATDVGGVRDLVVPNKTGYLVLSDDATTMAQKLMELFNDPAKAMGMGQAGKKIVYEKYDFMLLATKIARIYDEILKHKGRFPS